MADFQYEVALSYASEDGAYVGAVATELRDRGVNVFYDKFQEANAWGKKLDSHLEEVYRDKSRFIVIFISRTYVSKAWPNFELGRAQDTAATMSREYVLPVRFDDTEVPGLAPETVFIDLRRTSPSELATRIQEKLSLLPDARPRTHQPTFLDTLLNLSWPFALVLAMLIGVALIGWSSALGVFDLHYPLTGSNARQVGYGAALNWSLGYTILFPIAAALLLSALDEIKRLFGHLDECGMFQTKTRAVWVRSETPGDVLAAAWLRGTPLRRLLIVALGLGFPAIISLNEWYHNNFQRLFSGAITPGINDVDWGLACNFMAPACSTSQLVANVGLDLLAFLSEGFYVAIVLIFLMYVVDVARVLSSEADRLGIEFWPALRDDNPHRGFQQFEPLLSRMLLVVLIGYVLGYLVRIENLYLTSATACAACPATAQGLPVVGTVKAHSLGEFIQLDLIGETLGRLKFDGGVGDFARSIVEMGPALIQLEGWTYQTKWTGLGVVFLYVVAVVIVLATVRIIAGRARAKAQRYYSHSTAPAPRFGMSLSDERERADKMDVWPIGYLQLNQLIAWTTVAVVSLVWYRIGALILVLTLTHLLYRAVRAVIAAQNRAL